MTGLRLPLMFDSGLTITDEKAKEREPAICLNFFYNVFLNAPLNADIYGLIKRCRIGEKQRRKKVEDMNLTASGRIMR